MRKDFREIESKRLKEMLGTDDGVELADVEDSNRQERVLLKNRRSLDQARATGYEIEEMAHDVKYNLRSQTEKLQNRTLKNLFGI